MALAYAGLRPSARDRGGIRSIFQIKKQRMTFIYEKMKKSFSPDFPGFQILANQWNKEI